MNVKVKNNLLFKDIFKGVYFKKCLFIKVFFWE